MTKKSKSDPKQLAAENKSKSLQKTKANYCEKLNHASISYYHDRNGLEADIVLHLKDGRYALIECKLGSSEIEDGAKHLIQLRNLIRKNNKEEKQVPLREPDLLLVLTGGNLAYTREDGVKVIPLACLKW